MLPNDNGSVSDAASHDMAAPATPAHTTTPAIDAGMTHDSDAGGATVAALADDLAYTLTVGQALEMYAAARRKVPSLRTMQRYCIEGRVAAQKIRTTYGSEWLINENALAKLIEAEPIVAAVASDADAAVPATPAMPTTAAPLDVAGANPANDDAGAAIADDMTAPIGERRRLADVLIANAKLVAEVEGRDAIIAELKEDRNFLREEVREARKTRDDVKNIAERMLDTLKTMAIGRLAAANPPPEPVQADIIDPLSRQP